MRAWGKGGWAQYLKSNRELTRDSLAVMSLSLLYFEFSQCQEINFSA